MAALPAIVDAATGHGPVTVIVSRRIRPGCAADFEAWAHGICAAAARFPGHLGATLQRPHDPVGDPYVLVFRFDAIVNLARWNASPERADWVARATPMTVDEPRLETLTGLEHWFPPPPGAPTSAPPRHKMVLITWLAIFPLTVLIPAVLNPLTAAIPRLARVGVASLITVVVMTYVLMPALTRRLSPWLFRR